MSMIGVPIILAPVFGPTLGGLLVEHAGWQWIFFVNVPIGIVAVIAAVRLLPRDVARPSRPAARRHRPRARRHRPRRHHLRPGRDRHRRHDSLAAARARPAARRHRARRRASSSARCASPSRCWTSACYANRAFAAASFTTFCLGAALFGAMILMPLYFQTVRGEDAVHTGLLLDPAGHRRRDRDGALRPRHRAPRRRRSPR